MAMVQEEPAQKCSNSSSGDGGGGVCSGRSLKKLKQKKVPQRGLGVAQLEKIRLEEQHRRENNAFQAASNSVFSPSILLPNISSMSHLSPPSSIHSPPDLPSCLPKFDHEGGERGRSGLMIPGHSHWPKLWDGEYNLEGEESRRLDHPGIPFWPTINMPIEQHSSVLPLPTALQRSQQYQQPASSSMVNILSGISSSTSSLRNFQTEPPSNQIYRDNDYMPLWPEEVKMVGVKRPYPFSPEYPPVPSFNCKFPPGYASSTLRANNETTSCGNSSVANVLEPHNLPIREGISSSQFESNSRSLNRENGGLDGDFLSLAPPADAASSSQIDHRYHHSSRNQLPLNPEASNQRGGEEKMKRPGMIRCGQPHIFSFFPPTKVQSDLEESSKRSDKSESNGVVDLDLKL
ncbi:unnamed protein product [Cuscuta europaea]|uniref:Uncharacterized protein n=1 Tax=Cuscuta europaea TaxID=41803 RepID=A0A9P0ZG64_CUSEU|nr:unnamed protein product [Cuscuta europaea]